MTWTPAVENTTKNLDFELDGTDWTVVNGTPRYVNVSADGGTRAFSGGSSDGTTRIKQSIVIPADAKRARLSAWLGRSAADNDQGIAYLAIYNSSAELISGIAIRSAPTSTVEYLEYTEQVVLPDDADSAEIFVVAARGIGGTANNGICAAVEIDWFIDSGLTIYRTPDLLTNGDFEIDGTPPPGWTKVSGSNLITTTDSNYVYDGLRGATADDDATQVSEQSVNIPDGAEQVQFTIVSSTNVSSQNERIRAKVIFKDSGGIALTTLDQQGPEGSIGQVFVAITGTSIPVGAVSVTVELYIYSSGTVNTGYDAARLIFTSETAPIDVTGKFYVRLQNDTWLQLNPVFSGAGAAGLVPDPVSETDKYLRDDGTWQTPPGGGGGEANTASNIGTGDGVFASKVGIDLEFKSLVAGTNITLTPSADEIEISASGGGGAVDSVNGQTGVVVLDADDISDAATTNKWATAAELADIALNTADRHVAVTVTDSSEIDFTLTGQDITASLIAGSIDVLKLDSGVQASLALADSATQPGDLATVATTGDYDDLINKPTIPPAAPVDSVNGFTGVVVLQSDDISDTAQANKWATQAELDDIALNTADRHVAVTVTNSGEIDFTLTGQNITASLITGSIDIIKLDSGVQTSLGLADSALQSGDNISLLVNDAGYLQNVVEDVTPELGGDLDALLNDIHNYYQIIHDDTTSYAGNNLTTIGEGHLYADGSVDITGGDGVAGLTTPGAAARAMVEFNKTLNFTAGSEAFGTGFLFWNRGRIVSEAGSYFGGMYTLASQPTYEVAGTHTPTSFFIYDIVSQPTFEVTGTGGHNITQLALYVAGPIIGPDVVAASVANYLARAPFGDANGSRGDITKHAGLWVENFDVTESGANNALLPANFSGIALGLNALPSGNWALYSDFARPARWNGAQQYRITNLSANTTLGDAHHHVYVNSTAAARTITLPAVTAAMLGREYVIYNFGANGTTINTTGGATIDSFGTSRSLSASGNKIRLVAQATNNWITTG